MSELWTDPVPEDHSPWGGRILSILAGLVIVAVIIVVVNVCVRSCEYDNQARELREQAILQVEIANRLRQAEANVIQRQADSLDFRAWCYLYSADPESLGLDQWLSLREQNLLPGQTEPEAQNTVRNSQDDDGDMLTGFALGWLVGGY